MTAIPFNSTLLVSNTDWRTILKVLGGSPTLHLISSLSLSLSKIDSIDACKSLDNIYGISFSKSLPSKNLPSHLKSLLAVGLARTIFPFASKSIAPSAIVAIRDSCFI